MCCTREHVICDLGHPVQVLPSTCDVEMLALKYRFASIHRRIKSHKKRKKKKLSNLFVESRNYKIEDEITPKGQRQVSENVENKV